MPSYRVLPAGNASADPTAFHVDVLLTHVAHDLVIPGTHYVDPDAWDPLIQFFQVMIVILTGPSTSGAPSTASTRTRAWFFRGGPNTEPRANR
jgi:hypothetical protein